MTREQTLHLPAIISVWWRSVYVYRRTWVLNLLPNFFEPIIYMWGMGLGLGTYVGTQMGGVPYLAYLAPGLIISNAMNGGVFETTYNLFIKINFNRTYEAMLATPVNAYEAMLGEMLWAVTRSVLYGGIFAMMVVALGYMTPMGCLRLMPVVFLVGWLFSALGLLFTSYVKVIDIFAFFYTLFLMPMFLFSGIFFPTETLPPNLQAVAACTPLYHGVALARAAVLPGDAPMPTGQVVSSCAYLLLLACGCTWLGVRRLGRALAR